MNIPRSAIPCTEWYAKLMPNVPDTPLPGCLPTTMHLGLTVVEIEQALTGVRNGTHSRQISALHLSCRVRSKSPEFQVEQGSAVKNLLWYAKPEPIIGTTCYSNVFSPPQRSNLLTIIRKTFKLHCMHATSASLAATETLAGVRLDLFAKDLDRARLKIMHEAATTSPPSWVAVVQVPGRDPSSWRTGFHFSPTVAAFTYEVYRLTPIPPIPPIQNSDRGSGDVHNSDRNCSFLSLLHKVHFFGPCSVFRISSHLITQAKDRTKGRSWYPGSVPRS